MSQSKTVQAARLRPTYSVSGRDEGLRLLIVAELNALQNAKRICEQIMAANSHTGRPRFVSFGELFAVH